MAVQDPRALLGRLLQEKVEAPWLEFKHNNCDPEEIGQCVSACANAAIMAGKDRSFIVFGIEDRTRKRLGTKVRLNQLKKGGENFTNWISRQVSPRLEMEFLDFQDEGQDFAILCIEPTYDRPVAFEGVKFMRIGENTKKLKDFPEHERSLWVATGRRKFENAIALSHQTTDQVLENLDAEAYFNLAKVDYPQNASEIIRTFLARSYIREDMEGGFDITNLGAVLFARDIRKFPSIAAKSIRVIKYSGKDKRVSERESEGQKGYAVGFSGLIRYVLSLLPTQETYAGGVRNDSPIYPEIAIREVISNALIHQDFTITGAGPMIEVY